MKKTNGLLITLSTLSLFIMPIQKVQAEGDVTSRADVQFVPNSEIVKPVDPGGGGVIDPNKPPTKGPLSLNYASDIAFGQHKKTRQEQLFYAQEDTITVTETSEKKQVVNFVQITDLRGTAGGWTLSVRQNGPLKKENGVAIIGAKLTLSARSVESMYGFKEAPSNLTIDQVLSEEGQAHEIVKAEKGTGVSTWNVLLGKSGQETSGISLSVPKAAVKETGIYTTNLTWILQDAL